MKYRQLDHTNTQVSEICLDTMTWNEQNTEIEAYAQIDMALDYTVNFCNTTKRYPILPKVETFTYKKSIICLRFKQSNKRDKITITSNITDPKAWVNYIRNGESFKNKHIKICFR